MSAVARNIWYAYGSIQGSVWYRDTYIILTQRGLRPEDVGDSWLNQTYRQVVLGQWR